jgi:hypothetical protein
MPHGMYVKLRTCHVAPSLGYDMPHGPYAKPCHVASMQGIRHATYVKPRPCHVAPNLGYDMPHGTYAKPCHLASMQGIGHASYVRPKPCHVELMQHKTHAT